MTLVPFMFVKMDTGLWHMMLEFWELLAILWCLSYPYYSITALIHLSYLRHYIPLTSLPLLLHYCLHLSYLLHYTPYLSHLSYHYYSITTTITQLLLTPLIYLLHYTPYLTYLYYLISLRELQASLPLSLPPSLPPSLVLTSPLPP